MEKGEGVEIDESKLAELINSVHDSCINRGHVFSPTEDAFIIAVYKHNKNKEEAAKMIGINAGTMRRRYRALMEKR